MTLKGQKLSIASKLSEAQLLKKSQDIGQGMSGRAIK